MTKDVINAKTEIKPTKESRGVLVVRSAVLEGKAYPEYRETLRFDFWYSCAYCTTSESEGLAIRFTIDHYESREARKDLINTYSNLMYCCGECNLRKSDRCSPPEARADGYRFFRPDEDYFDDHFRRKGIFLESQSNTGLYSIETLDLNRLNLRRLRDLRARLVECDRFAVEGVAALRRFPIDQLPAHVKGQASKAISSIVSFAGNLANQIDLLLRDYARSPMIDPDPDAESRKLERMSNLKKIEALYPGSWRAPRRTISKPVKRKRKRR